MISIVDNFFKDPDKIVDFASSLKFKQSDGFYPGQRSEELHIVAPNFFNKTILKILALYFDYNNTEVFYRNANMYFQKIKPFDKNKKSILNEGLIHQDAYFNLAGVIYLNKKPDLNAGTSIYKNIKKLENEEEKHAKKKELYKLKNMSKLDLKKYKNILLECNKGFKETIKVSNIYNRLIFYPANTFHAGNYGVTKERLTLVFFIKNIDSISPLPITRKDAINPLD